MLTKRNTITLKVDLRHKTMIAQKFKTSQIALKRADST